MSMSEFNPPKGTISVAMRWIIVAAIIVAGLLVVGYFLDWFAAPLELTNPQHIRELSREANEHYQSLESSLASISALEKKMNNMVLTYGEDRSTWPQGKADEYLQLDAQLTNLVTAYNKLCGEYRAKWNDEWFDIPAPDDLPKSCDMIH